MPVRYSSGQDEPRRTLTRGGTEKSSVGGFIASRSVLTLSSNRPCGFVDLSCVRRGHCRARSSGSGGRSARSNEFSDQVGRLTREANAVGRMGLEGKPEALGQLGSAVNAAARESRSNAVRGCRIASSCSSAWSRPCTTPCWSIAKAFCSPMRASSRCSECTAADVVGRPLADFVAPEYVELVENNLRRRLAGEPAAERYEVELRGRARRSHARRAVERPDRQLAANRRCCSRRWKCCRGSVRCRIAGAAARHGDARCHGRERHHGRCGRPHRLHQSRRREAARTDASTSRRQDLRRGGLAGRRDRPPARSAIRCARR